VKLENAPGYAGCLDYDHLRPLRGFIGKMKFLYQEGMQIFADVAREVNDVQFLVLALDENAYIIAPR